MAFTTSSHHAQQIVFGDVATVDHQLADGLAAVVLLFVQDDGDLFVVQDAVLLEQVE